METKLVLLVALLRSVTVIAEADAFYGYIFPVPPTVPTPLAFFPLTEGSGTEVATWPSSSYTGNCTTADTNKDWWIHDDTFGLVLDCSKQSNDSIELSSVGYADDGNFTIAFWAKINTSDFAGSLFEYVYSHSAYGIHNTMDAFAPNTINIYLPEKEHPAFGVVRAIVKDETDPDQSSFLDSDGLYNSNEPPTDDSFVHVTDGDWHFVSVSSRLDGQKGFLIYVDGSLAAQLPPPEGDAASTVELDGGAPMQLVGDIVLCSRDDLSDDRHFSGSITHLSLYDAALTAQQISLLYGSVPIRAPSPAPAPSPGGLQTSAWLNQYNASEFLQVSGGSVQMCLTNETTAQCDVGYFCTPLTPSDIDSLWSMNTGLPVGVCALPWGIELPTASIPTPAEYFPLSNYTASAWPLSDQWFWNTTSTAPVTWVYDDIFGPVIDCQASNQTSISIGPQTWGASGAFAFNLWIRQREADGDVFQYVVSTRSQADGTAIATTDDIYEPNEVHIYLPELQHPAYGLVRAIVKDSTDNYTSPADANFLDSDGQVGSNDFRNTARLNLTDGAWHMVTLTTLPSGDQGFEIYVDGLFMAALESPQSYFNLSGGLPIQVDGDIVLCGRSDLAADRFFDGLITQFTIFDNALTSAAVTAMYNQVYWSPPITSQEAALAHNSSINFPPPLQQPTISPPSVSTPPATLPPPPASSPPPPATSPPPPAPAPPTGLFQLPATAGAAAGLGVEVAAPRVAAGAATDVTTSAYPSPTLGGVATESGSKPQANNSNLSGGDIAGIVIGTLAGVVVLSAAIAIVVLRARRRRMSGVARLQEVPMPQLAFGSDSQDRYLENQYVVSMNAKLQQGKDLAKPADL